MPGGRFVVHGASGSIPAPVRSRARYGGNTTSFGIEREGSEQILIDAGTGLAFAEHLPADTARHFHVLITHYHLDHLQGLQSFRPFFDARQRFTFYGMPPARGTIEDAIAAVFASPLFPVALDKVPSQRRYVELDGNPFTAAGIRIATSRLHHPQGALAYRLDGGEWSLVVATDHEADHGPVDDGLVELSRGAGLLVHDAQYTPEELASRYDGWGHSTWRDAVRVAARAGVERLVLTSHDPYRSDEGIDAIVADAHREFPQVVAAAEGLTIPL